MAQAQRQLQRRTLCVARDSLHVRCILSAPRAAPSAPQDVEKCVIWVQVLVKGEPNISYICSRYYRAPELIFGATDYTTAIDLWSVGCVMAELLLGQPLFPGESGVDQLVEIIKVCAVPVLSAEMCTCPQGQRQRLGC